MHPEFVIRRNVLAEKILLLLKKENGISVSELSTKMNCKIQHAINHLIDSKIIKIVNKQVVLCSAIQSDKKE